MEEDKKQVLQPLLILLKQIKNYTAYIRILCFSNWIGRSSQDAGIEVRRCNDT